VKALLEQWKELKALDLTTKSVPRVIVELQERVKKLEDAAPYWDMVLFSYTATQDIFWCPKCIREMELNEKGDEYICQCCKFWWSCWHTQ